MRQHTNRREHFKRGNAVSHPACRCGRRVRSLRQHIKPRISRTNQHIFVLIRTHRLHVEC